MFARPSNGSPVSSSQTGHPIGHSIGHSRKGIYEDRSQPQDIHFVDRVTVANDPLQGAIVAVHLVSLDGSLGVEVSGPRYFVKVERKIS
ncbi:MAG: hypothetical protein ACJAXZ_001781 [Akkermansiaceae bacterium]|jgi:hypothetical protein